MSFWEGGGVTTFLFVSMLLCASGLVRRLSSTWARLGIPGCILAGVIGLVFGPGALGFLPLERDVLEGVVYHGLALTFIAIGLQKPPESASTPDALSMGLGISVMAVLQGLIGILLVLGIGALQGQALHPGFGLLLPLGYNQGPGQALSMGNAWEASGLAEGGQVGLIIAAAGFACSILIGIPLIAFGRRRGYFKELAAEEAAGEDRSEDKLPPAEPGTLEQLTTHVVAIAVVYLLAYGVLHLLSSGHEDRPKLVSMLWGFHFLVALGISLVARKVWSRLPAAPLSNALLGRLANLVVDFVTCCALAAVQVSVLGESWLLVLSITVAGAVATSFGVLWLASRGFSRDRFQHAVLWFGASTGTLPMGLALLRLIDPGLRSAAPSSATLGSVFALVFSAPLLLVVMPYPIAQWPEGHPTAGYATAGILVAYLLALLLFWASRGGLRTVSARTLWAPPGD